MSPITLTNVQAVPSATIASDNTLILNVLLTVSAANSTPMLVGQQQYYLQAHEAAPLLDAPPTPAEMDLGLSVRDLVVVRAMVAMRAKGQFPLVELIPESLRPADPEPAP